MTLRLVKIPLASWTETLWSQTLHPAPTLSPASTAMALPVCMGPCSSWRQTMLILILASRDGLATLAIQSPAGTRVVGSPCRGDLPLRANKLISIPGTSEVLLLLPCLLTVL